MAGITNKVWQQPDFTASRYGHDMSLRLFMLQISLWTAVGIAFSAVLAYYAQGINLKAAGLWPTIGFMLGLFLVSLVGIWIANSSDSPVISLLGFALVSGAFGIMLGPVVAMYTTASIVRVFALTTLVVVGLGLIGALIPDDLSSWGRPLLGALLLLIVGMVGTSVLGAFGLPVGGAMTVLDWVGLVIFGGLVIFDLNRAARLPRTANNAIDVAVGIYLDFINIFIRLLSLFGERK